MKALLDRYTAPIVRRLRGMVTQAIVSLVDDGTGLQQLQLRLLNGETTTGNRLQHYGFTSVPFEGAQAIALAVGGNRSHLVAVAVDDGRHRKTGLQPGEVAIYTDEGDEIVIGRGGLITVKGATKVRFETPLAEFPGDVKIDGECTIGGIAFSGHKHQVIAVGSPSDVPQ